MYKMAFQRILSVTKVPSISKKTLTIKGEKSRKHIISMTRSFLSTNDLNSLRLDSIAKNSGIAKSSILWHFGSKNGLILAVVEDVFSTIQTWVMQTDISNLAKKERLNAYFSALVKGIQQYPEANALLIALITNKSIAEEINDRIKEMYNQYRIFIATILGESNTGKGAKQSAVILAFIDGAFLQWYLQPEEISLESLFSSFSEIL